MGNAWLFRGTQRVQGRRRIIHQYNTGLELLRYGRIVLEKGGSIIDVNSQDEEIGFVCLNGNGTIQVDGKTYALSKYDALYLPRESRCTISSNGAFDLSEVAAPSSKRYPVQFVRFEDAKKNPDLVKQAGFEPYARTLHTLIGEKNVQASRLLGRGDVQQRRQLDELATSRPFKGERRDLCLYRYAFSKLFHSSQLYRIQRYGNGCTGLGRGRRGHQEGLPLQYCQPWNHHRISLDDGSGQRRERSGLYTSHRATGV